MTDLPHPIVGGDFSSPVAPGTGWPDDPAAPDTPVARDADDVRRLAATESLTELDARAGKAHLIAVVETTVTPEGGQAVKKVNRYQTDLARTDAGWKLSALGPVAAGGA